MSGTRGRKSMKAPDTEHNPYCPSIAKIIYTRDETVGARAIKTFRMRFVDDEVMRRFRYRPGQCAILSVFGIGESMISITSTPLIREHLEFSILRMGRVTSAIHQMKIGDEIGIRGPYGNGFPIEEWVGKNIIFISGGIGHAPIRSVLNTCLRQRKDFGDLILIHGGRTSKDLVFKQELDEMLENPDIDVHLSVDVEEEGWPHFVGFVPTNVMEVQPSPENAIALTCGPPIMIKFVIMNLEKLGFTDDQIYTTVEGKMKCGIGKCGRCNIGKVYICKDGPVFNWKQLKALPQEY